MCGIAGLVLVPGQRVEEGLLRAMTNAVAHRGPDSEGLFLDGNVGLGHRRLSIIDLSAAADQPLANEDGSVQVILNGEIYNFQSLAAELEKKGYTFRTRSDTEVVVHGWEEWGREVVPRLRGMFVLVVYDRRRRSLFAARDRMGKKPFHYARTAQGFFFGSEIKALLPVPGLSRELDRAAVGEFMTFGNVVGERTAYRAIRRLLPGHTLTLSTDDPAQRLVTERYWRFEPHPDPRLDRGAVLEELEAKISEAVRLRLISDVPLGAFLSGGIDSSLIVAHMVRHAPDRVRTFTIGFREARWDESAHAAAVARHLGTEHSCEVVTADAVKALPALVETYDEPFADPSAIPTYELCRVTRQHVTVALSGDGGDELFLGYRRYAESDALRKTLVGRLPGAPPLSRLAARLFTPGSFPRRALERMSFDPVRLYCHAHGFSAEFLSLLAPEVRAALGACEDQPMAQEWNRLPELGFLDRCRASDLATYLPDQILVKADRASMRHALEVRCPLLDQEVVEIAAKIPARLQMRGFRQKLLLRELAYRVVPRELLERPKMGFSVPLRQWFRGELAPLVRAALADVASPTWHFFDRAEAGRRFAAHLAGKARAEAALWRLLFFHAWSQAKLTSP